MKKEKKRDTLITIVLLILTAIATAVIIIFRNTPIGEKILDSLAIIAGVLQFIVGIILFKAVKKSYLKILAFFVMIVALSMIVIHILRIAPVQIWKILGVRK